MSAVWRFALSPRWLAGHVLIAAFSVLFLFLAHWQWDRAHSSTGSWQNLGYSLQWPLFAVFLVAAWARFLWLEKHVGRTGHEPTAADRDGDGDATAPSRSAPTRPAASVPASRPVRSMAGRPAAHQSRPPATGPIVEDDPDDELAAYNAYLARLAAEDRQR